MANGRRLRIPGWSLWLAFAAGLLCVVAAAGHNLYRELRARQILDTGPYEVFYELSDSLPLGLDHLPEWLLPTEMSQRLDLLRPVTEITMLEDSLDERTWQATLEVCEPTVRYLHVVSPELTETQFAELTRRCPQLNQLVLSCENVADSWLASVVNCPQLEYVWIEQAGGVTADGLRHLASLSQLSYVSLDHATLAAREFEQLARCPQLETVELITSTLHCGEVHPQSLQLQLTELILTDCRFTPATLENLTRSCPRLGSVTLNFLSVEEEHLQVLASLPASLSLDLSQLQIQEQHLRHLPRMTKLEALDLAQTPIKDDAIPYLVECRSLRSLKVAVTGLTDEGVAELRRKLPHCTVEDQVQIGFCLGGW